MGGHIISHSKQKIVYVNLSYSKGFQKRAISLHSYKIIDKEEIIRIYTVSNTGIYCSRDKVGTVYLV
jgi:hypothetical protein